MSATKKGKNPGKALTMYTVQLKSIARTYKNNGQHAEQVARFTLTGKIEQADNKPCTAGGNCGIWFYEGWYYVDPCCRISTKWEALAVGRAENQISILRWKDMEIIYC